MTASPSADVQLNVKPAHDSRARHLTSASSKDRLATSKSLPAGKNPAMCENVSGGGARAGRAAGGGLGVWRPAAALQPKWLARSSTTISRSIWGLIAAAAAAAAARHEAARRPQLYLGRRPTDSPRPPARNPSRVRSVRRPLHDQRGTAIYSCTQL